MVTEEIKNKIRAVVACEPDPERQTILREELAKRYNLSLPQVRAITAWTKIWSKKNEPIPYNNPTKRAWRECLRTFITTLFPEGCSDKVAVILPGENWFEAIEVFIPLGFKTIYGIEREPTDTFSSKGERLKDQGCVPIIGDSVKIFKNPKKYKMAEKVDFVSLDYLGPVHPGLFQTLGNIHMRGDTLGVAVNVMGRRENEAVQDYLERENLETDCSFSEYMRRQTEIKKYAKGISHHRETSLGVNYFCHLSDAVEETNPSIPSHLHQAFFMILESLGQLFAQNYRIDRGAFEGILMHAMTTPIEEPQICMDLHGSFWYESEDGDKAKFFSDFIGVKRKERPITRYLRRIKRWFQEVFEVIVNHPERDSGLSVKVGIQKGDKFRKVETALEITFPWRSFTLPVSIVEKACDEGNSVIKQCLARRYYSDDYLPVRHRIEPKTT